MAIYVLLTNVNRLFIIFTGTIIIIPPVVVTETSVLITTVLGNRIKKSVFGLIFVLIIIKISSFLLKVRINAVSLTAVSVLVESKEIIITVRTVTKEKTTD